jgi:uncharacterized protein YmfQ (DUF2313 family)
MPIPSWSTTDFLMAFLRLLPRGRAWSQNPASVQNQCLAALMPTYVRNAASASGLLVDGFPSTTVQLIPEWLASLGLPDGCSPLGATIAQQQAQIYEKFTRGGGQSINYYIGVAAKLGYTITITEQAANTFTWTINLPAIAPPTLFRVGVSRAGDLLEAFDTNALLTCIMQKIKPEHTTLLFNYM